MPMTPQEMIKLLKKNGFEVVSQNGSHIKLKNIQTNKTVIVPYHSRDLKKGLEQTILKQAGLKQYFYPAVFHTAEEGGFWVSFPDFPECLTQGDSMEEAYEMANEALGLTITDRLTDHEALPVPSLPGQIELDDENSSLVVLCFDLEAYRKKHNSKAVKKTLSIPEWLNEEAMAKDLNFSQVLQEALLAKIQAQ